jgi:hypothetical protein
LKETWVEHTAVVGINDLGEMMVSRQVFEGNSLHGLTKLNKKEYRDLLNKLLSTKWPPGWKLGGRIHSHPWFDVINQIPIGGRKLARAGGRVLTWSGGDLNCCIYNFSQSRFNLGLEIMINANHISFMIPTKKTANILTNLRESYETLYEDSQDIVQRKKCDELGIVLYGGNFRNPDPRKIILERV